MLPADTLLDRLEMLGIGCCIAQFINSFENARKIY